MPEPPFWRPDDPVLLIQGVGRSYAHGEDGRFSDDGSLYCRFTAPVPRMRSHAITVVADRVLGPAPQPAAATALALALAANVTAARLTLTDDVRQPGRCDAAPWWHAPSRPALYALLAHAQALSGASLSSPAREPPDGRHR